MDLTKKTVHYTQEGKTVFDRFYLDEDYNVPEQKEAVQRIVYSSAKLKTEDVRPVENYVKVTGKAYYKILYMTQGETTLSVLEGKIPFEEMIYAENDGEETFFIRNERTEFTVSVVHSRKLTLRVAAEMELGRERMRDEELTTDAESDFPVYKKRQKMNVSELKISKKDTYRIKEEIVLPGTKESIGQILFFDISGRKAEIRPGQDELLIRGEAEVFCMYLSPEEKVEWIEQSVPYEGRIPCEGAEEDMICQIRQSLEDPIVDIRQDGDGEMRALGIEATLSMKMNVYSEVETEILKDMYSLDRECVLEKKEGIYEEMLMYNQAKCKIAERLTLPELKEDVLQIIHSEGSIQAESERYTEEGVEIEGILHISFLYLRADDEQPYGSWTGMIPFSYLVEYPNLPKNVSASPAYHVEQLAVTLAGSEAVEVKAVLTFDIFLKKLISASMITNVSERQFDTDASLKRPGWGRGSLPPRSAHRYPSWKRRARADLTAWRCSAHICFGAGRVNHWKSIWITGSLPMPGSLRYCPTAWMPQASHRSLSAIKPPSRSNGSQWKR